MRKLVSLMHMSLDGYVAGPQGELDWIRQVDAVWEFVDLHIVQADTGLYGPTTFAMMESHWPSVLNNANAEGHQYRHARWYAAANKIVLSRSVDRLDNPAARLITDNIVNQVTALKNQAGGNLMLFGSPRLVHSLAGLGLIDEYVLTVSPLILAGSIPMFSKPAQRTQLKLISSTVFEHGGLGLHYAVQK